MNRSEISEPLQHFIVRTFPKAVKDYDELAVKDAAVSAILRDHDHDDFETVTKWLSTYRVFQGIPTAARQAIVLSVMSNRKLLRESDASGHTRDSVLHNFGILYGIIANKDEPNRSCISMTSKLLWARFPNDVAIYDAFVRRAICVLQWIEPCLIDLPRLGNPSSTKPLTPELARDYYTRFFDLVTRLLVASESVLEQLCADEDKKRSVPLSRVRMIDKLLFQVGSVA